MNVSRLYAIPLALLALVLVAIGGAVLAENIDPAANNSQFAWGENTGWINAEPANCSNCGVQVGTTGLTGYMWGENIGWINTSCKNNYGPTCTGSPGGTWGVNKAMNGALSGYAWAENVGWISMSCTNTYGPSCTGSPGGTWGVTVNPADGVFTGYAWAENIGWIGFSDTSPVAYKVQTFADTDADGVLADIDNCPAISNPLQENADGDPFGDACETLDCVNFATVWTNPTGDSECDGFPATLTVGARGREDFMGTDPADRCADTTTLFDEEGPGAGEPLSPWPPDVNDNRATNLSDVVAFGATFNKSFGQAGYNARMDLTAGPGLGAVNLSDIVTLGPFFNKNCTP